MHTTKAPVPEFWGARGFIHRRLVVPPHRWLVLQSCWGTLQSITVEAGATLEINNSTLSVGGDGVVVRGRLILHGGALRQLHSLKIRTGGHATLSGVLLQGAVRPCANVAPNARLDLVSVTVMTPEPSATEPETPRALVVAAPGSLLHAVHVVDLSPTPVQALSTEPFVSPPVFGAQFMRAEGTRTHILGPCGKVVGTFH
jgi:hypothetical protein